MFRAARGDYWMAYCAADHERKHNVSTDSLGFLNKKALRIVLQGALLVASPAWASLGDNVTSVQTDKAQMKGALRSVATQHYVIYEIQASAGQLVREFVFREKELCFGIAWDGPSSTRPAAGLGFMLWADKAGCRRSAASWTRPDID